MVHEMTSNINLTMTQTGAPETPDKMAEGGWFSYYHQRPSWWWKEESQVLRKRNVEFNKDRKIRDG